MDLGTVSLQSRVISNRVLMPFSYRQRGWLIALLLALAGMASESLAQTGKVTVIFDGLDGELLRNVQGTADIWQFNGKPVPSEAQLRYLHARAIEQSRLALQPFGYYRAEVSGSLTSSESGWQALYKVVAGEQIRLDSVDIKALAAPIPTTSDANADEFSAFDQARDEAGIAPGQALNQQVYDSLKQNWQTLAARLGYFDAEFLQSQIRINLKAYKASIVLHYQLGERYQFGEVSFDEDRGWIKGGLLSKYTDIVSGDYFDASDLQQLQSDLSSSEYYSDVQIRASPDDAVDRVIPIQVSLVHQNPRRYIFGVGYGTDTGARVKLGLTGRRINKRGHRINGEAQVSEIGSGIAAEYTIPTGDPRTDSYGLRASYQQEDSESRKFNSFTLGGNYKQRDGLWFKTYALDYQLEEFELEDQTPRTRLLIPSVEWTRTYPAELEKRINVIDGTWLLLRLRGGSQAVLSDTSFVQAAVFAKWIRSFAGNRRLIVRGGAGTTWVDNFDKVPASLRFYTGGDRTVRGYDYEVIGPLGADNEVAGGRQLLESSIEYEVPIKPRWSLAAFVDTGDAFDDEPELRSGVGLGVRWQSPIGPVRIDLGRSLNNPGRGNTRLHLSIGPDL